MDENNVFEETFDDEAGGVVADGREREPLPVDEPDEASEEPAGEAVPAYVGRGIPDGEGRTEDLRRFVMEFPDLSPEDLPREVWDRALAGESLVTAYLRHKAAALERENAGLSSRVRDLGRQSANRARAAGSLADAGKASGRDAFDLGWDNAW